MRSARRSATSWLLKFSSGFACADIGSGWGGLALASPRTLEFASPASRFLGRAARDCPAARSRRQEPHRASAIPPRGLSTHRRPFDRIVSVGMFEHVGPRNYAVFAKLPPRCWKRENGSDAASPTGRPRPAFPNRTFCGEEHFPGGYIPALRSPAGGRTRRLPVKDIEILLMHYA